LCSRARSVRRGEEIFQRTDSRGGALEFENFQGERKTVSVLFANVKGSAELETRFKKRRATIDGRSIAVRVTIAVNVFVEQTSQ
jgi:hypothetical protein